MKAINAGNRKAPKELAKARYAVERATDDMRASLRLLKEQEGIDMTHVEVDPFVLARGNGSNAGFTDDQLAALIKQPIEQVLGILHAFLDSQCDLDEEQVTALVSAWTMYLQTLPADKVGPQIALLVAVVTSVSMVGVMVATSPYVNPAMKEVKKNKQLVSTAEGNKDG